MKRELQNGPASDQRNCLAITSDRNVLVVHVRGLCVRLAIREGLQLPESIALTVRAGLGQVLASSALPFERSPHIRRVA